MMKSLKKEKTFYLRNHFLGYRFENAHVKDLTKIIKTCKRFFKLIIVRWEILKLRRSYLLLRKDDIDINSSQIKLFLKANKRIERH